MSYRQFTFIGALVAALNVAAIPAAYAQESAPRLDESGKAAHGPLLYTVMDGSSSVAVIDLFNRTVVDRYSVEGDPHGGAITPDGRFIYTASMDSN